jgi:hypothetical protein
MATGRLRTYAPAMRAAIVDTDVVSILFKCDSRAMFYSPHLTGRLLAISFMTWAELERWPLERKWGGSPPALCTIRFH